ncbi:thiolase family protein [Aeromicrobium sp. CTD01-1L150]|uniref:thiolase family protein n=1 Tax=Aeromicrobium sp. CTD01-1L150 TaxID=3341830 RepID=UPI0035C2145B
MNLDPVHVIGAGMSRFGRYPKDVTLEAMGTEAARAALRDAGATAADVEAVYVGHVFGGPVAGQRIATRIGLAGRPVSNHENYCSSGATALREAWIAVGAGLYDVVLVLGVEKMTDRIRGGVQPDPNDLDAAIGFLFAAGHGLSARRYMEDYGATREQIAAVAVKNHRHSTANPYAQYQHEVTLDDVLHARPIAEPLGLLDCSPISDGAAAVVVASPAGLRRLEAEASARIEACALVSGTVQTGLPDVNEEDVSRRAGHSAYELASVGPGDIDFVEMHDCFTIAEIVRLEGLELLPRGRGAALTSEGYTSLGGQLPVNPSGGLLSRGHPVGATGAAQVCELFWQLTGQAGGRQVENARTGLAYCKGGSVSGTDGASVTTVLMTA